MKMPLLGESTFLSLLEALKEIAESHAEQPQADVFQKEPSSCEGC